MSSLQRSLEQSRLEIVLLAIGVFSLVSLLGILVFVSSSTKPYPKRKDTEQRMGSEKWGAA
jgi:hypothetical protein